MKCPKCEVLLNEVTRAGVLVDVCPRCLGMWLERGELEKIAHRLREVERDDDDDRRYARPPEPYRRHDDDDARRYSDDRRHPDDRRYADDPRYHVKKKKWTDLFEIFD
jgi:Zn-finger nucleic acid-binding protein